MIYYINVLSKNGVQRLCNSQTGNEKELNRLLTDGWIVQHKKEFTNLELARRTRILIENDMQPHIGRMVT